MTKSPSQAGVSLIGVLVALFILVSGTVTIAQLNAQNKHYVGETRVRLLATSLAEEGLELAQAYRDTTWIQYPDQDWTGGLCDVPSPFAIDSDLIISSNSFDLYQDADGIYSHAYSNNQSPFQRRLEVDCDYQDRVSGEDDSIAPHITITSTVTWEDARSGTQDISLTTVLYDWYK